MWGGVGGWVVLWGMQRMLSSVFGGVWASERLAPPSTAVSPLAREWPSRGAGRRLLCCAEQPWRAT